MLRLSLPFLALALGLAPPAAAQPVEPLDMQVWYVTDEGEASWIAGRCAEAAGTLDCLLIGLRINEVGDEACEVFGWQQQVTFAPDAGGWRQAAIVDEECAAEETMTLSADLASLRLATGVPAGAPPDCEDLAYEELYVAEIVPKALACTVGRTAFTAIE